MPAKGKAMAFPLRRWVLGLIAIGALAVTGCSGHHVDHSGSVTVEMRNGPDAYVPIDNEVPMVAHVSFYGEVGIISSGWHLIDGPDDVVFDDPEASDTIAVFSTYGTYLLIYQVRYHDGYGNEYVTSDEISITVDDPVYG
jgi:hypothetical protein